MIYIYDVLLNYSNSFYYDFFEWEKKDNLVNVQKIPCFYVNNSTLYDFINYKIKVEKNFLKFLENKSIYLRRDKGKYLYSAILSNKEKCIGICFDEKGFIKYKSALLLDEEEDINRIILKEKEKIIKYKKFNNDYNRILRCDLEKKSIILKEIKKEYLNREYDKLRYIYYEIYNKVDNDIDNIYKILISDIDKYIYDYNKLFDYLKIK